MALVRSENITKIIDKSYLRLLSMPSLYTEIGKESYVFPFWVTGTLAENFSGYAIDLIKFMENFSGPVLEIGCGGGQFLHTHGKNREIYGLSVPDDCIERKNFFMDGAELKCDIPFPKHKNHYFGNAEHIDQIADINQRKYSLIFSKNTFIHFKDTLGSLKRAYNLLKENGILLVDMMSLNGITNPMPLLWSLHKQGYQFIANVSNDFISSRPGGLTDTYSALSCFIIRKTIPTLDIPLDYAEDSEDTISYKYTPELLIENNVDYSDKEFLLKIADNEFIQAYAIEKIFQVEAHKVTNNPVFLAKTGQRILEESADSIVIPLMFTPKNITDVYSFFHFRKGTPLKELVMNSSSILHSLNQVDCYGFKPIHIILRLDNLEIFTYLIGQNPKLLQEKTENKIPMTVIELAIWYSNNIGETHKSKIFRYLEKESLLPIKIESCNDRFFSSAEKKEVKENPHTQPYTKTSS